MEVFLTATAPAETLRVSKSGRVYTTNAVVVFFSRARSAALQLLGRTGDSVNWQAHAREAVLNTFMRDISLPVNFGSAQDKPRPDTLLSNISASKNEDSSADLRTQLSMQIDAMHASRDAKSLGSALKTLKNLSDALKAALQSHLLTRLGLSVETAKNASKNIHWAMTHFGCDFKEALAIACCVGDMIGQKQCEAQFDPAMLLALIRVRLKTSLEEAKQILHDLDKRFSEALPSGWPDQWEAMPDGSRRLAHTEAFSKEFLSFLKDSFKEGSIDPQSGLSTKFLADAGRTHFRFGIGPDATEVDTDASKAIKILTQFVPDPTIRQSLSRCLFQGGGNGLKGSMALSLAAPNNPFFSIFELDPDTGSGEANSTTTISLQVTEEGKIRVGYTVYMNHFSLGETATGRTIKINSGYDSSTPASATNHTAVARGLVEFDMEQLRQGIIDPVLVRDPELRLTIEPDRPRLLLTMLDELMNQ